MSKNYKPREISLYNKFQLITDPVRTSDIEEFEDNGMDQAWLAKSRQLQARRWRKINDES